MTDKETTSPTDDLEAIRAIRKVLEPFGTETSLQILGYVAGQYQRNAYLGTAGMLGQKIMSEGQQRLSQKFS